MIWLIVIVLIIGLIFISRTDIFKKLLIRAKGTANEMIANDAGTVEGAKAYYNSAIEAREDDYRKANELYSQMVGKKEMFERDLLKLRKQEMQLNIDINDAIDRKNDERAKILLEKQSVITEQIAILKENITQIEESITIQKDTVDKLVIGIKDLKKEKDTNIFKLETAQTTASLKSQVIAPDKAEDKMLEKVRDSVRKAEENATGIRSAYHNSLEYKENEMNKQKKEEELNKKLDELKKSRRGI